MRRTPLQHKRCAFRSFSQVSAAAKAEYLPPGLQPHASVDRSQPASPRPAHVGKRARRADHKLALGSLERHLTADLIGRNLGSDPVQSDEYIPAHPYVRDKPTGSQLPGDSNPASWYPLVSRSECHQFFCQKLVKILRIGRISILVVE